MLRLCLKLNLATALTGLTLFPKSLIVLERAGCGGRSSRPLLGRGCSGRGLGRGRCRWGGVVGWGCRSGVRVAGGDWGGRRSGSGVTAPVQWGRRLLRKPSPAPCLSRESCCATAFAPGFVKFFSSHGCTCVSASARQSRARESLSGFLNSVPVPYPVSCERVLL